MGASIRGCLTVVYKHWVLFSWLRSGNKRLGRGNLMAFTRTGRASGNGFGRLKSWVGAAEVGFQPVRAVLGHQPRQHIIIAFFPLPYFSQPPAMSQPALRQDGELSVGKVVLGCLKWKDIKSLQ